MRLYKILSVIVVGAVFALLGCNEENQTAEVHGTVYWAEADIVRNSQDTTAQDTIIYLHPAEGVQVYLEQDESSDNSYMGEDLYTTTDKNGEYSFTVYLGRNFDESKYMFDELKMCDVKISFIWTPDSDYTIHNPYTGEIDTTTTVHIAGQLENEITGLTIKSGTKAEAPRVIVGTEYIMR